MGANQSVAPLDELHALFSDQGKQSVPVSVPVGLNESPVFRNSLFANQLVKDFKDLPHDPVSPHAAKMSATKSFYGIFSVAAEHYPENRCLGSRLVNSDKTLGAYGFQTYAEINRRARTVAAGLKEMGD
jgi:hypothetical protein